MDESKGKEQKEQSNYTLILHKARNKLGLTNNEYILCDTIHKLKNNSKFPGWCYATKETLGQILDI